jgi:hypothetical protein
VIVRFDDIGGVDDHRGLKLSFVYSRTRAVPYLVMNVLIGRLLLVSKIFFF